MPQKNINFAIIGCGYVAQRHAKNIVANPEANLVGVYDIDADKTNDFANTYHCQAFETCEDLLQDKSIEIVSVCTPNGHHHEASLLALQAKKAVLVEKPMSIKKSWCEQMIKTALANNKALFVVKQNRFNPPVQAVFKLLKNGQLGKIYSVNVNCFWNRNERYYEQSAWRGTKKLDGGTLFTQFSHFIDVLYYLFGDIEVQSGMVANMNHQNLIEFEDTGHFIFQLKEHNALGQLSYSTSAYKQNMEGSITILAENATIKIGGKYLNTIDYQTTNGFDIEGLPVSNASNNYGFYEGSMSNHEAVISNAVAALKGREPIMANAYDGLKVVEIIEQLYAKAQWI